MHKHLFKVSKISLEQRPSHSVKLHRIRTPYSPDTDSVLPYKAKRSPYRENTYSVFGEISRTIKLHNLSFPNFHKYMYFKAVFH